MGMLSKQMTNCKVASALNTGSIPPVTSQSYALKVIPKANRFLNRSRQVKPSIARSPSSTQCSKENVSNLAIFRFVYRNSVETLTVETGVDRQN